jgi:hypothetical protein
MKGIYTALLAGTTAFLSATTTSAIEIPDKLHPAVASIAEHEPEIWEQFLNHVNDHKNRKPPKFDRRPDSEWDYIVDGKDVVSLMAATGQRVEGNFANKKLRIKSPEKLGVDKVKQYSGYIDVGGDRHIFFCLFSIPNTFQGSCLLMPPRRVL